MIHTRGGMLAIVGFSLFVFWGCGSKVQPFISGEEVVLISSPDKCEVRLRRTRASLASAEYERRVIVTCKRRRMGYDLPLDGGAAGSLTVAVIREGATDRFLEIRDNLGEYWFSLEAPIAYRIERGSGIPLAIQYTNSFEDFSVVLTKDDIEKSAELFNDRGIATVDSLLGNHERVVVGRIEGRTGELKVVLTE